MPIPATPAGSGGNNTLSGLTISAGTLAPVFASGTTAYTVSVPNGVESLTVTPTAANAGAVISISGRVETSGVHSGALDLTVGDTAIAIKVNGGGADNTYTITVTRATGPIASPNPVNPTYAFKGNLRQFSKTVIVSNPNDSIMTISFPATWPYAHYYWDTSFPIVIPGGWSAAISAHVVIETGTPTEGFLGGTWSCGGASGTMEARITAISTGF